MKSLVLPELQRLNIQLLSPCLPERCILDLDSTVETVYGNQEGAAVGVNAHKLYFVGRVMEHLMFI
ncbi:transposase [Paenibacillus sp. BJ-4]|uniref:transposase n=1 Tax=Paenibacillus sp. BJ-4 TaxID=2878097 RepID=UPI001CEFF14C|nr:transposase [Paenibacillus sp. BJ-4]